MQIVPVGFAQFLLPGYLRKQYPPGTMIQLTADMKDERLQAGDIGKVIHVDDIGTIHTAWRSGSSLGLIPGEDSFRKIDPEKEKQRGNQHER